MENQERLEKQVQELRARFEALEQRLARSVPPGSKPSASEKAIAYCAVPETPEREFGADVSVERASLIRVMSKKDSQARRIPHRPFSSARFFGKGCRAGSLLLSAP